MSNKEQCPLVSVIIPAYNCEKFIMEAVESARNQTYPILEIIIINDYSTDNTFTLLQNLASRDKRIIVLNNDCNMGVANTRNRGIAHAKGEYIAFLDGDDVWLADKIKNQLELLETLNADFAYCSYDFIDEVGASCGRPYIVPSSTSLKNMLAQNIIGCSTCLLRTYVFSENSFNNEFYHEDYVLWLQLLQKGYTAVGAKDVFVHYRKMRGTRSNSKINAAKMRWKIYRNYLKMPVIKSCICFFQYAASGFLKHYIK